MAGQQKPLGCRADRRFGTTAQPLQILVVGEHGQGHYGFVAVDSFQSLEHLQTFQADASVFLTFS